MVNDYEKKRALELYQFYIQFNFHMITVNKITWELGITSEEVEMIVKDAGIKVQSS